jgi:hypothetical protein
MTTSFESKSERTDSSTQEIPTIPTVQEMRAWDKEKVLQWIQKKHPNILKGGHLEQFKEICIDGDAFLLSSLEFFHTTYNLPLTVAVALKDLMDEVKEGGKFIPRT